MRVPVLLAALALAPALAGCNELGGPAPATSVASTSPSGSALPPGAPCSGEINRFQSVVKDDLDTGNVEKRVYAQIQTDIGRATAACSAGRGGEAHSIIAGSKARHGYRA